MLAAENLERIESSFEVKINVSKSARGDKPTQLPKARKAQLRTYANDAAEIQKEQLALFEAELSSRQIVSALHAGLESDLRFWSGTVKHTHPKDMAVVEEFAGAKRRLLASLTHCLATFERNAA